MKTKKSQTNSIDRGPAEIRRTRNLLGVGRALAVASRRRDSVLGSFDREDAIAITEGSAASSSC